MSTQRRVLYKVLIGLSEARIPLMKESCVVRGGIGGFPLGWGPASGAVIIIARRLGCIGISMQICRRVTR